MWTHVHLLCTLFSFQVVENNCYFLFLQQKKFRRVSSVKNRDLIHRQQSDAQSKYITVVRDLLHRQQSDAQSKYITVVRDLIHRQQSDALLFKGTNFCVFCDLEKSAKFKDRKIYAACASGTALYSMRTLRAR